MEDGHVASSEFVENDTIYLSRIMLVTHALSAPSATPPSDGRGGHLQAPNGKHENQRNPLLQIEIQPLQLRHRQRDDDNILHDTQRRTRVHDARVTNAPGPDGQIPDRRDGHALQRDDEQEGEEMACHPAEADLSREAEAHRGEDP